MFGLLKNSLFRNSRIILRNKVVRRSFYNSYGDDYQDFCILSSGMVGFAVFLGNVFNGISLGKRTSNEEYYTKGVIYGITKGVSYSFFSWLFPIYVIYVHNDVTPYKFIMNNIHYEINEAHWLLHFIPGSRSMICAIKSQKFNNIEVEFFKNNGIIKEQKL